MYWLLGAVAVDGLALAAVAIVLVFTIGRPVMLKARPAPAPAAGSPRRSLAHRCRDVKGR